MGSEWDYFFFLTFLFLYFLRSTLFPVAIVCKHVILGLCSGFSEQARLDWLLLYLNSHVLFLNVYGFEDLALLFFYFIELSIS